MGSQVKYSSIPLEDVGCKIDFSSPFDFGSGIDYGGKQTFDFKSPFVYSASRSSVVENGQKETRFSVILSLVVTVVSYIGVLLTFPVSIWFCVKVIKPYDRLVVFRLGRLKKPALGPGMVFIIPCIDRCVRVDTRTRAFSVPPQKVFTKDGAVIELGAEVQYEVHDPTLSVISTQDLNQATRVAAQTTLLKYVGKLKLSEIETGRPTINVGLQSTICQQTFVWGIKVTRVEISQVKVLQTDCPLVSGPPGGMAAITNIFQQLFPNLMHQEHEEKPFSQLVSAFATEGSTIKPPAATDSSACLIDIGSDTDTQDQKRSTVPVLTPKQLLEVICLLINDNLVRTVDAVYQFEISGEGGGVFHLNLKYGHGSAGEGPPTCGLPDATIAISVEDIHRLFTGELKAMQAYISGLLCVSGDLSAAMRLEYVVQQMTS